MILIEESLLPVYGPVNVAKIQQSVINGEANGRVRQVGNSIRDKIGDDYCPIHPNYISTIVIGASETERFIIKKVDFCCKVFENSIDFLNY